MEWEIGHPSYNLALAHFHRRCVTSTQVASTRTTVHQNQVMTRHWHVKDVYTCLHLPLLCLCISPLKEGLAWIRIGSCSKLTHNNPVGSHVPTVRITAQVATLVGDPTCSCDMKT